MAGEHVILLDESNQPAGTSFWRSMPPIRLLPLTSRVFLLAV